MSWKNYVAIESPLLWWSIICSVWSLSGHPVVVLEKFLMKVAWKSFTFGGYWYEAAESCYYCVLIAAKQFRITFVMLQISLGPFNSFSLSSPNSVLWLTNFINKLFCLKLIPRMWRRASIVAILKPGKDSGQTSTKLSTHFTAVYLIQATETHSSEQNISYCRPLSTQAASWFPSRKLYSWSSYATYTEHRTSIQQQKSVRYCFPGFDVSLRHCLAQGSSHEAVKIIKCKKMTNVIMELLHTRTFVLVTSDGQKSRPHRLKNGLSQGSVLAPTLYNINASDFP